MNKSTPTKPPTLSIGMPVFNGELYLRQSLDALLAQDYTDFELIISDNASTDRTSAICNDYASRDPRIRYFRNACNIGASPNYNRLVQLARGQFFKWAAHDDVCLPGMLRRCVETLQAAPESVVLVYPQTDLIDGAGVRFKRSPDRLDTDSNSPHRRLAHFLFYVQYGHPLWGVIRLETLRKTRLLGNVLSDFVLLAELALLGRIREVPEVLFQLRLHEGNAIQKCRTQRELLEWHNPARVGHRVLLPLWVRLNIEYFRAIQHAGLARHQRVICRCVIFHIHCWRTLLRWTGPARRFLGMESSAGMASRVPPISSV
jgi:glycosyltransferase involved in cell wall biosynthesis